MTDPATRFPRDWRYRAGGDDDGVVGIANRRHRVDEGPLHWWDAEAYFAMRPSRHGHDPQREWIDHQLRERRFDVVVIHDDQVDGQEKAMPVHVQRRIGARVSGSQPFGTIPVSKGNYLAAGMEASQLLNVDAEFMNRNMTPLIVVVAVGTYGTEMPTMMITPYNDIVVGHGHAFALLKDQQFEFPFRGDRTDARFYDVGAYTRIQQVDRNRDPVGPLRHVQHPIRDAFDKAVENAVTGFLRHGIPPQLTRSEIPGPPSKPVAFDVEANGNVRLWLPKGLPADEYVDVRVGRTSTQCVRVVHDKQLPYPPGALLMTEGDYGPELLVMRHPEEPTAFPTAAESFGVTQDSLLANATVDPTGQLLLW